MSGGSMNYICFSLKEACANMMEDVEMEELIGDLCELLHDCEWYQSGDMSREKYKKSLSEFKNKWFNDDLHRADRLKKYVDMKIDETRRSLYELLGVEEE